MSSVKIIGLVGGKQSGKDTVANCFKQELLHCDTFAFAAFLKQICSQAFNLSLSQLEDGKFKEIPIKRLKNKTPRQILQNIGDAMRSVDPNVFVNQFTLFVDESSPGATLIVTDVRFLVEAMAIRARGGILINVSRPGFESNDEHVSELEHTCIKTDYEIKNVGTIDELQTKAQYLLTLIQNQ